MKFGLDKKQLRIYLQGNVRGGSLVSEPRIKLKKQDKLAVEHCHCLFLFL